MRVIRHPEVPQELEGAVLWYEERQPGLGEDFLVEYQATLSRILREPERWRKFRGDNRSSTSIAFLTRSFTACIPMSFTSRPSCTSTGGHSTGRIASPLARRRWCMPASVQPGKFFLQASHFHCFTRAATANLRP
jgi:hypothetical protein